MSKFTLFKTIFFKEWIEWKRYAFNLFSGIITLYLIFIAIFVGLKFVAGNQPRFGENVEGLIVGFFIWTYAMSGYSTLSWSLIHEAMIGTLEQLYMTPFGFKWVTIFTIISSLILNLVFIIPMLFLMMLTTGRFLHFDFLTLIPLLTLTISGGYGIGYLTGGLGLIFKKLQAFFQVLQFLFIGCIAAPVERVPWFKILPFSLGTNLIAENMIHQIPIYKLPLTDIGLLILNSAFYIFLGFFIFNLCEKYAKDRALLGHY